MIKERSERSQPETRKVSPGMIAVVSFLMRKMSADDLEGIKVIACVATREGN